MRYSVLLSALLLCSLSCLTGCSSVLFGNAYHLQGSTVYYLGDISESDAQRLAEYLFELDFFEKDQYFSVQLRKRGEIYELHVPLVTHYRETEGYPDEFLRLAGLISQQVFNGAKVEFHAANEYYTTVEVIQP